MTRKHSSLASALFIALFLSAAGAASPTRDAEHELQRICQELGDAVAPGHVEVWRKYLDDRLVRIDENGAVQTKGELLKELTPLPPGLIGSMVIEDFHATVHGAVAVATYDMQESLDYHGQMLHSRFRASDTWIRTPAGWRLIAEHVAAVLKDPPAIKLPQSQLCAFDGTYGLTPDIEVKVHCSAQGLSMERSGRPTVEYLPETDDVFFAPGQPRSRRLFERDADGTVVAMLDRREGEDIRWLRKQ